MKMAIKLFFITGVPWVFEIVAWLPTYLPEKHSILYENSKYFLEVGNLLNSLRGVIIFIVFILLQRDVRRYLKHRFTNIFVSKKSSKMNDNSRANAGSISASTQQSTTISRLSILASRVTEPVKEDEEEQNTKNQIEINEITYL